jgi:glyoxylase-like metal-dependent hydrolase (beta-lactamase superfamily II)
MTASADTELLVEDMGAGILRLSEPMLQESERSFFYLITGGQRYCLIDGGWGLGPGLPDRWLPSLIAVATHSHFDHIGHLYQAATRLGHSAEAAIFADPQPEATQAAPWLCGRPVLKDGAAIDPIALGQRSCPLTEQLDEGAIVDLGGRRLAVLHTPGHSPGSISLYDDSTQSLFCGDVLLPGHIYDDIPGADPALVGLSHRRLASLPFRQSFGGHGPVMDRDAALARMARYAEARSG